MVTEMQLRLPVPWIESVMELCDNVIINAAVELPENHPLVAVLIERPECARLKEARRLRSAQGNLFERERD
jgi:hypothetical protein